jgi:sugar lactone lactonase YvrE
MFLPIRSVTHRSAAAFAALIGLSLGACTGAPDAERPADPDTPMAVVDSGLATPESVLWDAGRNVWYVSNINGQPPAKDDNGYIVRLGPDGALLDSLPFINGADDDVTLHAPKGMALVGDTLWVADIDAVRAFNVISGTEVATVDLAPMQATFLNDVAAGGDGTIYITDTGIAFDASGNVTHPGKSQVFALRGRTAEEAVELPRESAANGIAWHPTLDAWMIVGFNTADIYAWVPGTSSATVIGSGVGGADGVVLLADGRAVYSSWADSSLNVFEGGASTTLRKGLPAPADLGYDPARGIVAVPLFQNDRVEFWRVP